MNKSLLFFYFYFLTYFESAVFKCFTPNLLSYTYRFICLYESINTGGFHSISSRWFYKVSYLVRNGLYDYKKYRKVYFSYSQYYFKSFALLRFKIIELSFCFLVISFCKFFYFERLTEWVWLVVKTLFSFVIY